MAARHSYSPFLRRFTALGMIAFLVLSSSRALIPGLCATQAELFADKDGECRAHACCIAPGENEDATGVAIGPDRRHIDCAFCQMATARVLATPTPIVVPETERKSASRTAHRRTLHSLDAWTPAAPRGPPGFLL